ncbi:RHS repeat domain-containing protein [Pseudomonas sp. PHC1]|uniref:RHS repeat domain-containing protein n=1 Tax=Pseudomonas sp. PHC1 TaxID=3384759 RepID=UPI00396F34E1
MNASVHWHTPSLAVTGPRGEAIRTVEYLRKVASGPVQALVTRQQHDLAGRPVAQYDPRLVIPNTQTVFALNGQPLRTANVDSGTNATLRGLAGESLQTWDANGNHRRMFHDPQLRMVSLEENGAADIETFTYASATANAGNNLRGNLIELKDPSGSVEFKSYALTGQPLSETRTFTDAQTYTSQQAFSPLGAMLESTDAGGHQQRSFYNVAGQLVRAQLKVDAEPDWITVLQEAHYNAADQIVEQLTGNDVSSRWHYNPADERLHRQVTQKASAPALQDFEYQYDRVGNITRIIDHTYVPTYFKNQQVDGHREFSYDSLSRLTRATGYSDAPPKDNPGRPQPTDPKDRRNYVETYEHDSGGNLIKTIHVRDGIHHTLRMCIDPASNRGVRCESDEPPPDFTQAFDPAGNLLTLQPGRPMRWNNRNELEKVTLVDRGGTNDDQETFRYSQGERVYKRLETHASKVSHFHEVRYLSRLEIRTKDNGERLHVIVIPIGAGEVRCLHWKAGKPPLIDKDQLRYTHTDHLRSALLEVDHQTRIISHERYFPFGGTATLTARDEIEVDYKTVRFSGKEKDFCGVQYFGDRYYADWLQRWISADPAGNADGLNRYAYVANNPVRYIDLQGREKAENVIHNYSRFINVVAGHAEQTIGQLHNIFQKKVGLELLKNLGGESVNAVVGFVGGYYGGQLISPLIPDSQHYAHLATLANTSNASVQGKPPFSEGLSGGNVGADLLGAMGAIATNSLTSPLIPQTSKMSVAAIDKDLGLVADKAIDWKELPGKVLNPDFLMTRVIGSVVPGINAFMNMGSRVQEAEDIINQLDPVKINKIETMLADWKAAVIERWTNAEKAFDALGTNVIYPADLLPNVNNMTSSEAIAPVRRSALKQATENTLNYIDRAQKGMAWYKKMGTTDNQFLQRQAHPDVNFSRARHLWSKVRGLVA